MKNIIQKSLIASVFCLTCIISATAQNVSNITFKDTDIKVVLASIAQLAKNEGQNINIVASPAVTGTVTIDLSQVDWETALNVVLHTYNLDSYRQENVIMVSPLGPGGSAVKNEIQVKVFHLRFIDSKDALKAIDPILSGGGRAAVLETTGESGWEYSSQSAGSSQSSTQISTTDKKLKRTSTLVVSDTAERLDKISTLLNQLDVMPKQILIKARILEVDYNLVKDSGLEWGTGSTSVDNSALQTVKANSTANFATNSLSAVTPTSLLPATSSVAPGNSGFQFAYKQLSGSQFEVVLHALEDKLGTNTLSAPILMALNNQQASILVGQQYPITQTTVSSTTNNVVGGSLQYYQDIGIKLNVIPQIWGEKQNYINMIIHPVVSTNAGSVPIQSTNNGVTTLLDQYPIINTQESETQLVTPDNGTVMMGGLITDLKNSEVIGTPFLSEIPYLGKLFTRTVKSSKKVELLIFITAHIMTPEEEVGPNIVNTQALKDHFDDKSEQPSEK